MAAGERENAAMTAATMWDFAQIGRRVISSRRFPNHGVACRRICVESHIAPALIAPFCHSPFDFRVLS